MKYATTLIASIVVLTAGSTFLPFASGSSADQPVVFTGADTVFSAAVSANGELRLVPPFLHLTLEHAVIRSTSLATERQHVVGYRVGLAYWKSQNDWDVVRWSDRVPIDIMLNDKETAQLSPPEIMIPIDGLSSPLQGRWLVFEVDIEKKGVTGMTYSHANHQGMR